MKPLDPVHSMLRNLCAIGMWLFAAWHADVCGAADPPDDGQRLIYLADGGPSFLQFHFQIEGQTLDEYRSAFIEKQFRQYDRNSDGVLEESEAVQIPTLGRIASGQATVGEQWKVLDTTPSDGKLSVTELGAHFEAAMGRPFVLTRLVRERFQDVDLLERLDEDRDHGVSAAEIQDGLDRLIRLDLDDDETISAAELAPLFDPSVQQVAVAASQADDTQQAYPFLLVRPDADFESLSESIIAHYDRAATGLDKDATASKGDGRLERNEIPAAFDVLRRHDRDRDGKLSVEEIVAALKRRAAGHDISVEMPRRGRPTMSEPQISDRNIEFRIRNFASDVSNTVAFYRIRFLQSDGDKNKYIDVTEFGGLQIPDATFEMCDLDGNGQLYTEELVEFMDQRTTLSRCQVVMRVELERRSLFELLDGNLDRRLSPAEFLAGMQPLADVDMNGDGVLAQSEIESRYRVFIELARPPLFQTITTRGMTAESTSPRLQEALAGPVWFRRMDANLDGGVSRREFLGPRDHFEKLDLDGNGLLSASEAEQAIP